LEIVEAAIKKSEGSQIKVEDIDENKRVEKLLYGEKQSLVKNPYLAEDGIEKNVHEHRDTEKDNSTNVVNTPSNSRTVLADFIRNKIVYVNKSK
jgi:hypothetical protein